MSQENSFKEWVIVLFLLIFIFSLLGVFKKIMKNEYDIRQLKKKIEVIEKKRLDKIEANVRRLENVN